MRSADKHPLGNHIISNSTGDLVNCDRVLSEFSSLLSLSLQFILHCREWIWSNHQGQSGPTHKLTRFSLFSPIASNEWSNLSLTNERENIIVSGKVWNNIICWQWEEHFSRKRNFWPFLVCLFVCLFVCLCVCSCWGGRGVLVLFVPPTSFRFRYRTRSWWTHHYKAAYSLSDKRLKNTKASHWLCRDSFPVLLSNIGY